MVWIHSYPSVELTLHLWVPQRISYEKFRYRPAAGDRARESVCLELNSTLFDLARAQACAVNGRADTWTQAANSTTATWVFSPPPTEGSRAERCHAEHTHGKAKQSCSLVLSLVLFYLAVASAASRSARCMAAASFGVLSGLRARGAVSYASAASRRAGLVSNRLSSLRLQL